MTRAGSLTASIGVAAFVMWLTAWLGAFPGIAIAASYLAAFVTLKFTRSQA